MRKRCQRPAYEYAELFKEIVNFDFTAAPVTEASHIVREVGLWPLARACGLKDPYPVKAAEVVLLRYRNRLWELQKAGWQRMLVSTNLLAAANCLPETVRCTASKSLRCHLAICPWCHMRRVTKFLRVLQVDSKPECESFMSGKSLMRIWRPDISEQRAVGDGRQVSTLSVSLQSAVTAALQSDIKDTLQVVRGLSVSGLGATWWLRNWPAQLDDGGDHVLHASPNIVVLLPTGVVPVIPKGWSGRLYGLKSTETDVRDCIRRVAQEAFSFPPEILQGEASATVDLMQARGRLHLNGATGVFRTPYGAKSKPTEDAVESG